MVLANHMEVNPMAFDHRKHEYDPFARSPLGDFGNTDYSQSISGRWIVVGFLAVFGLVAMATLVSDRSSTGLTENVPPPAIEMVPPRPTVPTTPIPAE